MRHPTDKTPENYGWVIIDGSYGYYWFDGPESPSFEQISPDCQGNLFLCFFIIIYLTKYFNFIFHFIIYVEIEEDDSCQEDEDNESDFLDDEYESTDESDED